MEGEGEDIRFVFVITCDPWRLNSMLSEKFTIPKNHKLLFLKTSNFRFNIIIFPLKLCLHSLNILILLNKIYNNTKISFLIYLSLWTNFHNVSFLFIFLLVYFICFLLLLNWCKFVEFFLSTAMQTNITGGLTIIVTKVDFHFFFLYCLLRLE